jgi:hypothetical protein
MFTRDIKQWISTLHEEDLILAKKAYEKYFVDMKEATFYQLLARLNEEKYIGKIAKGLYYKPKKNDFDALPSQEKLLSFFTNKDKNGMIIGRKMLENNGVISDNIQTYDVITNTIEIKTKRYIANLVVENFDVDFKNIKVRKSIEILELIELIDSCENINTEAVKNMINDFIEIYSDDDFFKALNAKGYKKRNVAAVKVILDHYGVNNSLARQLNTASKYAFPEKLKEALGL